MDTLLQDIRYGLRLLGKNPGFTLIAVLVLALGIGASTAVFSVVNGVLLRPLPFPHPEQLIQVVRHYPNGDVDSLAGDQFLFTRDHSRSFSALAAMDVIGGGFNLISGGAPAHVSELRVTPGFFRVFGVSPQIGRGFTADEGRPGSGNPVVLSHGLWAQRFGSDANIQGKVITLSGTPYTVVGVMPAGFQSTPAADLWIPLKLTYQPDAAANMYRMVGRLNPGVPLAQAQSEMKTLAVRLHQAEPHMIDEHESLTAVSYLKQMTGDVRPALLILLGAVGLLLLIACANVANLLLARATVRSREIAIRSALGAGRIRLLRQLLTESVLLSLAGGALGLVFCFIGFRSLLALLPEDLPRATAIAIDGRVLAFTVLVALVTGILFGLVPGLQSFKLDVNHALREAGTRTSTGASGHLRNLLVVSEFALSLVLLAGAVLLMQTFVKLHAVNPGFDPQHALTMQLSLTDQKFASSAGINAFFLQTRRRIESLPGVEAAAFASTLPMELSPDLPFLVSGQKSGNPGDADWRIITPGYFRAMGTPLLQGRSLQDSDDAPSAGVVVINAALARQYFPRQNPIGQHIVIGVGMGAVFADRPREIVGIVGDMHERGLDQPARPTVFVPWAQLPDGLNRMTNQLLPTNLVVRSPGSPLSLTQSVPQAVLSVDPGQPAWNIRPMQELVSGSVAAERFAMLLLGLFAVIALVLATAGIYGVMSYTVTQRTREFGIRMLLGAGREQVLRMVVRQALTLALIGAAVGLAASVGANRLLGSMLYGVKPYDPLTLGAAAAALASVALAASYLPARRATEVDPIVTLRYE